MALMMRQVAFALLIGAAACAPQEDPPVSDAPVRIATPPLKFEYAGTPNHSFLVPTTSPSPQVSADAQGRAVAIWVQWDGDTAGNGIWVARFDGREWRTPERIGMFAASAPRVDLAPDGRGIAAWTAEHGPGGGTRTEYSLFHPSSGWSPALPFEGTPRYPAVRAFANGGAVALWTADPAAGDDRTVWATRFMPDTGWTPERGLLRHHSSGSIDFSVDGQGRAVAVWRQTEGDDRIYAARFDAAGGWDRPQAISGRLATGTPDRRPAVALGAGGNGVAVWGNGAALEAARFVSPQGWTEPMRVDGNRDTQPLDPLVAADDDGDALIAWPTAASEVWASRLRRDGVRMAPQVLGTGNALALAADGLGNGTVVWVEPGPNADLPTTPRISRYSMSIPAWSPPEGVATRNVRSLGLDMDGRGHAFVLWIEYIGNGRDLGIWCARE
jgi:hypothetical protein